MHVWDCATDSHSCWPYSRRRHRHIWGDDWDPRILDRIRYPRDGPVVALATLTMAKGRLGAS